MYIIFHSNWSQLFWEFDVTVERVETVIFDPTFKVPTRSTDADKQIFKRGAMKNTIFHVLVLCIWLRLYIMITLHSRCDYIT